MPEVAYLKLIWSWLWPLLVVIAYAGFAFLFYRKCMVFARKLARRSKNQWDDLIVFAVGWPLSILLLLVGVLILFSFWPIAIMLQVYIHNVVRVALILALVLFGHQLLTAMFKNSPKRSWLRITLLRKAVLFTIYTVGSLMVLRVLTIDITPILATLGVGSLAVALAVREILANFFAGIQLAVDRPLEIGESVTLENNMAGEVQSIGWMKTHMIDADGTLIIIPNARLLGYIIRNHDQSEAGVPTVVTLTLKRETDLDRAEEVARDVGLEVLREQNPADEDARVKACYTALSGATATLTVTIFPADHRLTDAVLSLFLKRIGPAYAEAGVELV